jgi:hypothetical protein
LADNSLVTEWLSGILQCGNGSEEEVCCLEDVSQDIDETECKDCAEDREKDEGGSTREFPSNEVVKEAVEVGEMLLWTTILKVVAMSGLVQTSEVMLSAVDSILCCSVDVSVDIVDDVIVFRHGEGVWVVWVGDSGRVGVACGC